MSAQVTHFTSPASYRPADTDTPGFGGTVGALLRRAEAANPNAVAVIEGIPDVEARRQWTYSAWLAAAESGARNLLTHFLPGHTIAVWAPNSADWLLLQQAAALAGVVLVTVNPAYRHDELVYVLRHSEAVAVFCAEEHRGNDLIGAARRASVEIATLEQVCSLSEWSTAVQESDSKGDLPVVDPESIAMIQYTSGTTGAPKGVRIRHRSMVDSAWFVARRAGLDEGCVWINPMPTFHIGSCGTVTLGTVSLCGTQVVMERFEPGLVLELMESCRADVVLAVPTMLIAILEHPDLSQRDVSSIKTIVTGGSTASAELVRRVKDRFGCKFSITFGQTETSGPSTQTDPDGSVEEQSETIGRPLPHTEVRIVDPVTGSVLPAGVEGEICSRSPMVMAGYLNRPDDTSLRADGWLHYGDLGSMDADGCIKITGRLKDMIIRGGENISPREIEEVLCRHPLVADAAVVGVSNAKWGETVAAVVRTVSGAALEVEELTHFCAEGLSRHKVPTTWRFVDEFPLTPSGKVQKFKLREQVSGD